MRANKRLLLLCTSMRNFDALVERSRWLAKKYEAGVTLLYVKEEKFFELPIFEGSDGSIDNLRERLLSRLRENGLEEWALLVYDNDVVDHARLEAEREESFLYLQPKTLNLLLFPILLIHKFHLHQID